MPVRALRPYLPCPGRRNQLECQNPINARKGITTELIRRDSRAPRPVRILLMPVRALRPFASVVIARCVLQNVRILLMPVRALRLVLAELYDLDPD